MTAKQDTDNRDGKYTELIEILLDSQAKSVEQMTSLAIHMKNLADGQTEILKKLSNGLKDEIVSKVEISVEEKLKNCSIAKDMDKVKWFVVIVGVAVIIVSALVRFYDDRGTEQKFVSDVHKIVQTIDAQNKKENKKIGED